MNSREILGQWIVYLTVNKSPDEKALRELDQLISDMLDLIKYGEAKDRMEEDIINRAAQAGYGEK